MNPFHRKCVTGAILLVFAAPAFIAQGQIYFNAVGAGLNSRSFKQYAAYWNQNPAVLDKLDMFGPAYGFSVGIEPPSVMTENMSFASLHMRQLTASASMEIRDMGKVNYRLRYRQYLMSPFNFGKISAGQGSLSFILFNTLFGWNTTRLTQDIGSKSGSTVHFKNMGINVGLGATMARVRNHVGFTARLSYIGNLLPRYDDQLALRTENSSYLEYRYEGEDREVKSDMRGVHFELGVFLWFSDVSL